MAFYIMPLLLCGSHKSIVSCIYNTHLYILLYLTPDTSTNILLKDTSSEKVTCSQCGSMQRLAMMTFFFKEMEGEH